MALENRRICPAPSRSSGAAVARRRCRSPARPFCCMPSRGSATPSSSSAMRRCWQGGRKVDLRSSAGAAAAVVAARTASRSIAYRRAAAGIRPALSVAQSSAGVRDAAATIPADVPYLAAPAERAAYWRDRLPPGRPRAGFVWSGSSSHKNDANRSIALVRGSSALFENPPVAMLQPADASCATRIAKRLRGLPNLIHLGDDLRDFADTAAIISLLDVVVSVDTAVAHLAGALGKPVVILLPHAADFRWMRDRDDTPWYPTAKLLRQPAFGDWDSVIACCRRIDGWAGSSRGR